MSQKKIGVILSYLNLAMGMAVNLFLTPMMIDTLGDADYSLYKVMQSFAGPLAMFHLGISTVATRSIIRANADEGYTRKDKENTMAMAMLASGVLSLGAAAAAGVLYSLIPGVYGTAYEAAQVAMGRKMFLLFAAATVLHMLTDTFSGCLAGHERYAVSSGLQLGKTLLRVSGMYVLLKCGAGAVWIVAVDFLLAAGIFLCSAGYSILVLGERLKLTGINWRELSEILSFGAAILLQTVVNQVNNNVDTMILGAYVEEKQIITMYASALAIYGMYHSLTSVPAKFFLPDATRLAAKKASGTELTDFVIRPGRFQAMIAVGCICGFALTGRHFIAIWIGEQYMDAYWVALVLMIPVTIPLVENTAISILDAAMKRIYRSAILCGMAAVNVLMSLAWIRLWGFWGVALGTVISVVIGHGLLMNLYYAKTFHMEIGRMFSAIFQGILPAGVAALGICIPLEWLLEWNLPGFLLKGSVFAGVYGALLWRYGMNTGETKIFRDMAKKLLDAWTYKNPFASG